MMRILRTPVCGVLLAIVTALAPAACDVGDELIDSWDDEVEIWDLDEAEEFAESPSETSGVDFADDDHERPLTDTHVASAEPAVATRGGVDVCERRERTTSPLCADAEPACLLRPREG